MKYQEIKKHIGQTRLLMLIVVLPVFAAVAFGPAVLTWLLHEKKHFLIAVLWMLFMGSVWVWQFIKTFTAGSKLKKIMETVGAETDEEMDALLEQAADFDGHYFMTDTHFINFETVRAYPRSEVRPLKCCEKKENPDENGGVPVHYMIKLEYGGGKRDKFSTRNKAVRDRLWQIMTKQ